MGTCYALVRDKLSTADLELLTGDPLAMTGIELDRLSRGWLAWARELDRAIAAGETPPPPRAN